MAARQSWLMGTLLEATSRQWWRRRRRSMAVGLPVRSGGQVTTCCPPTYVRIGACKVACKACGHKACAWLMPARHENAPSAPRRCTWPAASLGSTFLPGLLCFIFPFYILYLTNIFVLLLFKSTRVRCMQVSLASVASSTKVMQDDTVP